MLNESNEIDEQCPICQGLMQTAFTSLVLKKYQAKYFVCDDCGLLQAYKPHWLEESYSRAIATADTGIMFRNFSIANKLACVLYFLFGERGNGRYLDSAGGYGILTRIMRDYGFNFYWADKYCDNLVAAGFEYNKTLGNCSAVTAMEVMEHLTDPMAFIKEMFDSSGSSVLIFTTEFYEGAPPLPDAWWYYSFATGQHVSFFKRKTLEVLAIKLDLHFSSANGIHILSKVMINETLLSVMTSRVVSSLAPLWVRRKLGSKTMIDHEQMLHNIK